MITLEQLKKIIPTNKEADEWLKILNEVLPQYDIDTPIRLAGFLAQSAHESSEFNTLEENLNYSAEGLVKTWPRRFTAATAKNYARKPEAIANRVYADRMANGNEASGDGWRFRGRGIKQLTGRDNYTRFGKDVGMTAEKAAEYCSTKKGAVESAAWFWKTNDLNRFADADDILSLTKAINGGTIGIDDRKKRYSNAKTVLAKSTAQVIELKPAAAVKAVKQPEETIKRGDKGDKVKAIQKALGLTPDGIFGIATEVSLRIWQSNNNMVASGVATSDVYKKLVK